VLAHAADCTVSVVDWEEIQVNGKSVVVYKLGLGEVSVTGKLVDKLDRDKEKDKPSLRSVRISWKRLDELVFLREKLQSDFPQLGRELPPLPVPPVLPSR
jgi:hypothetical protein